jgi:hypothetical protein
MEQLEIRDHSGDRKYFTIIPNYVLDNSSGGELALYAQLKRLAGEKGVAYSSRVYLMKQLDISDKTYYKQRDTLLERGWIKDAGWFTADTNGGKQKMRAYEVVDLWTLNNSFYSRGTENNSPLSSKGTENNSPKGTENNSPKKNYNSKEDKFSDENLFLEDMGPPSKVERGAEEPQTFESYMQACGYTKDSLVDDVGATHSFWVDENDKKLTKREETSLRSSFARTRVLGAVLPQPEAPTDVFVKLYKSVLKKKYGQEPIVGWETKKILKKNLIDKYPKDFINDYAEWFVANEKIDRKWKYSLRNFASETFINDYLSSKK